MSDIDVSNSNSVDTNSAVSSTNTKKNKDGDDINNKKKNKEKKNEKDDNIVWGAEHEKILVEWADKAMCYHWLHSKSNQKYSYINLWFTIPVIIISTVTFPLIIVVGFPLVLGHSILLLVSLLPFINILNMLNLMNHIVFLRLVGPSFIVIYALN